MNRGDSVTPAGGSRPSFDNRLPLETPQSGGCCPADLPVRARVAAAAALSGCLGPQWAPAGGQHSDQILFQLPGQIIDHQELFELPEVRGAGDRGATAVNSCLLHFTAGGLIVL